MLENQFIRINSTWVMANKHKPLPFAIDDTCSYCIFLDDVGDEYTPALIEVVDEQDNVIQDEEEGFILQENLSSNDSHWIRLFYDGYLEDIYYIADRVGQKIFLRITYTKNGAVRKRYSCPLVIVPTTGFSAIEYRCYEDALGFPFATVEEQMQQYCPASILLPIRLHSPQNVQEDKTYVKANGEVVTLYAKYYKEWEGETEYLSEEIHDKIVAALSCDEVYIDGKRVTKTDNYKVDWDNYDLDCDGTTKLAKATFKVREHIANRNSNY